jgi:hypothetical protein
MPRNRYDDPDTPGLYVQVSCRRANDPNEPAETASSPGHLQISTHDERADARAAELLGEARGLIAALVSTIKSGEAYSDELDKMRGDWMAKAVDFRAELTGTYVTLTRQTAKGVIRALHRGANLAWPPEELVTGALDDVPYVQDPAPAETEQRTDRPGIVSPGATGYRLS